MNKFIFSGNLTADPELAYSSQGKAYTKFTVAVTRPFDREKTDFFRCTTFGKQAENLAQHQKKGNKLLVEGQVNIDQREDKYYTNVIASQIEYLTPKNSSTPNTQQNAPTKPQGASDDPFKNDGKPIDVNDDDLPF